jgi:hypothetical protein
MAELDVAGSSLITISRASGPETCVVIAVNSENGKRVLLAFPTMPAICRGLVIFLSTKKKSLRVIRRRAEHGVLSYSEFIGFVAVNRTQNRRVQDLRSYQPCDLHGGKTHDVTKSLAKGRS